MSCAETSSSVRRIFTCGGASTPIRTLSPLTRTMVSTMSSPRWTRSDSLLDNINILRFHSPYAAGLLWFLNARSPSRRRRTHGQQLSRSCEDYFLDAARSSTLTGGIIKQDSRSRDIKDRSQSDASWSMQTIQNSAGVTLLV